MSNRKKDCGSGKTNQKTETRPPRLGMQRIDKKRTRHSSTENEDSDDDFVDGTTQSLPPRVTPKKHSYSPTSEDIFNSHPDRNSRHTSGHSDCHQRHLGSSPPKRTTQEKLKPEEVDDVAASPSSLHHHHHHHHHGLKPAALILACFLLLIFIYSLYQSFSSVEEQKVEIKVQKPIREVYNDLKLELKTLNQKFSQPKNLWLGLLGQLENVMVDEPQQPAVFLLVVPDDSKGVATCLAHSLARAVQYAFEDTRFVMFDMKSSKHQQSSSLLKIELDESLKALAETHAAVVHNVESIPGVSAMILHAYCDNYNAPYKQAIIFLVVEVPGKYEDLAYSRLDSVVDTHLAKVWQDNSTQAGLAEKDVSALISRTANSPILIRPELSTRVLEICPL